VCRIGRLRHFAFFKDVGGEQLNGSHAPNSILKDVPSPPSD
jgi:hypothetical protein